MQKRIDWLQILILAWMLMISAVQVLKYIQRQRIRSELIGRVSCFMYNPVKSQTDSSPHYTSIGEKVHSGIIAVSQDLLSKISYYDMVYIKELDRYFYVMDCMNKRQKMSVDIFSWDIKQARAFGKHEFTLYHCRKMQRHEGKIMSDFRVYYRVDPLKIKELNNNYLGR